MALRRIVLWLLLALMAPSLSGCWYAVAAGAGATAGYLMRDAGYKAQSPVEKEAEKPE
jgi:hypothetical protein